VSSIVYYFSGTGNSLAVARDISLKLNAELIPIPSVIDQPEIQTESEVIAVVFPVYYAEYTGVPLLVWRFVEKLQTLDSKYIFAVATHSGNPSSTIEHLAKLFEKRGGKLGAGFTVYMDVPYPVSAKLKRAFFGIGLDKDGLGDKLLEEQEKACDTWKAKLETIIECVSARREGKLETPGTFAKILTAIFLPLRKLMFMGRYTQLAGESKKSFYELVPLADRSFEVDERCNGCGVCSKVCPVANIALTDGKPCWLHHCENCFACFKWCPQEAIAGKIVEYGTRFHHPEVKLADIINQRTGG
jgi:ferredoxin